MNLPISIGMRPKGSAAQLEERRRRAVALIQEGCGPTEVARMVGASKGSVTRWRQTYERGGEDGLDSKPHPGRPPKLSARQRRELAKLLLQGARHHGLATELWTLSRVAELVRRKFGISYHPGHVWRILRGMGWSSQKPERRARERDEQEIERWRREEWPRLKKRPKGRQNHRLSR